MHILDAHVPVFGSVFGSAFPVLFNFPRPESHEGALQAPPACLETSTTGFQGCNSDLIGQMGLHRAFGGQ